MTWADRRHSLTSIDLVGRFVDYYLHHSFYSSLPLRARYHVEGHRLAGSLLWVPEILLNCGRTDLLREF